MALFSKETLESINNPETKSICFVTSDKKEDGKLDLIPNSIIMTEEIRRVLIFLNENSHPSQQMLF